MARLVYLRFWVRMFGRVEDLRIWWLSWLVESGVLEGRVLRSISISISACVWPSFGPVVCFYIYSLSFRFLVSVSLSHHTNHQSLSPYITLPISSLPHHSPLSQSHNTSSSSQPPQPPGATINTSSSARSWMRRAWRP